MCLRCLWADRAEEGAGGEAAQVLPEPGDHGRRGGPHQEEEPRADEGGEEEPDSGAEGGGAQEEGNKEVCAKLYHIQTLILKRNDWL